jgi:hypothetical protein
LFCCYKELESIGVLTDFDDGNCKNWLRENSSPATTGKSQFIDSVMEGFHGIKSKPMEYWLLKKQ